MGGKASLLLVMGFSFILAYIAFNLDRYATSAVNNMASYNEATASHNLALTGANVMLSRFYQDSTLRGTFTESFDTTHGGNMIGSFTATLVDIGLDKIRLQSVSTYPRGLFGALHDTVEVYFDKRKYNSFTLLAWMTNFEGNDNFWVDKDTAWGRVHSNGQIHINGSPVFRGKVTASKGIDPKPGSGANKAIFKQGSETGVATIAFPNDLKELWDASISSGGRHYIGSKWVELNPGTSANGDGYILVRDAETGPVTDSISLSDPAFTEKVLLTEGDVNVKGTLDGALTITSMTNVNIRGDINYEVDAYLGGASDDVLGLVSNNSVVVSDNLLITGEGNRHVDASIFARTGSYLAQNYNTRGYDGVLTVHGSIVQNIRGKIGTYSGNTCTSGYDKDFRYDQRLNDPNFRPPHYPGFWTPTLAITNWWESYRINVAQD